MLMAVVVAIAVAAALMLLVQQAAPASAQISIGSIVCPILRNLQASLPGFLSGIFTALLAAFGC